MVTVNEAKPMAGYVTLDVAAAQLGVDRSSVFRRVQLNKLPGVRVDGRWLVWAGALESYKPRKRRPSAAAAEAVTG